MTIFENESIPLKYHQKLDSYELDFSNDYYKIDVEIDGDQHYNDEKIINHDIKRNNYLENLGWMVIRIRWSYYQKLTFKEKEYIISKIKRLFNLKNNLNKQLNYEKIEIEKYFEEKIQPKLEYNKLKEKKERKGRKSKFVFTKEQLLKDFYELKLISKVAKKYNCAPITIHNKCKELNINIQNKKELDKYYRREILGEIIVEKPKTKYKLKLAQIDPNTNQIIKIFNSGAEMKRELGFRPDDIFKKIRRNSKKTTFGYYWKLMD